MRQAHLVAPGSIELRDGPTPTPHPGEVLVKIRAALTCGTDLKTYRRGHPKLRFGPFGHEASGDVVAVGEGVAKFSPGDAIMWVQTAPCGSCEPCKRSDENLCERLFDEVALGAYADHLILPRRVVEKNSFRKPPALSYIEAAFLEPLGCIVHGWNVLKRADAVSPLPRSVAIVGAGTIGMLHLLYAVHAKTPATIYGRRDDRKKLALELGATEFAMAELRSAESATLGRALQGGAYDAVIEAAGTEETWQTAIALTRPGGRTLLFGGLPPGTKVAVDATRVHYDELRLLGAFHFTPADVAEARDLLVSGAIKTRPLITAIEPLDAIGEVFERLDRREGYKYALVSDDAAEWV